MYKKQQKSCDNLTGLSKKLSWLLRHGAVKEGLHIQPDGFVKVQDILEHQNYKNCFTMEVLQKLVAEDQKQRYTLQRNALTGQYEIRANQGHTLKEVEDEECLKSIMAHDEVPMAVHGTYYRHWDSIKAKGLNRMSRNHIHFAISDSKRQNISGFRSDCQLLIYLDIKQVLESGHLKLYRSENNVVLCTGLADGSIPTKYFAKVVDRRTEIFVSMANDKDCSLINSKCSFCGHAFSNIQECLKHELLSHHMANKNKQNRRLRKKADDTEKYLNSSDKLEERKELRKKLNKAQKGEELRTIFELFCMKTDDLELIFTRIQTSLEKLFTPSGIVKIYPFGSIVSGLALRDCDIDVYIDVTQLNLQPNTTYVRNDYRQQNTYVRAFNCINRLLHRSPNFSDVFAIRKARVPIIKCKHTSTGFSIDINVECPSSRENSQFIYQLVRSDDRIHELMLFIKLWAKNMQIIGGAYMNSYCLISLVIFFLQQPQSNGERILKSMKELQKNCPVHMVQGVNYAYDLDSKGNSPKIPDNLTTWNLIKKFFSFYKNFDFDQIISPYYGKAIDKTNLTPDICDEYYKQLRTISQYLQGDEANHLQIDRSMCVQDIFCLNQNTAKTVLPQSRQYFIFCLENANKICENSKNLPLAELCEQLLFDTVQVNATEVLPTNKPPSKEIKNVDLNAKETISTNNNDKLSYTITISKADVRTMFAHVEDLKDTESALQKCCEHYLEAIEMIMTKIYRMDMQKQLPTQQKQIKLDEDSVVNNMERCWLISCTVDLWTNRQFQKYIQTSFMTYHLEQTERLHNLRRQDPNYSVTINATLKLKVLRNFAGIDVQILLPEDTPLSSLHKKNPLRKFFNVFKNTLQNYNLKEALQSNAIKFTNTTTKTVTER
ncbi:hypothetical protein DOY81_000720 [Sarcophaga bullata]|nr:hypothetical protein DOY81_000720 [Sarcophaga bullata]